ncbi:MAG: copper resistance protein CopC [Cumulibacter sp.]
MIRRLLAVLVGALIAALGVPAAASAHTDISESVPADGAEVDEVPGTITLTFAEDLQGPTAQVGVLIGDNDPVQLDAPVQGPTVTIDTSAPELADVADTEGQWAIAYTIVGQDGHPIDGTVTFTVTEAAGAAESESAGTETQADESADTAPASEAADEEAADESMSSWLWLAIVAVIALVVFGVVKTERMRRKKAENAAKAD